MLMYLLITTYGYPAVTAGAGMRQCGKTVIIALCRYCRDNGVAVFAVSLLFDRNTALVTIPPLVGGIVSSLIMSQGAKQRRAGRSVRVLAILIYVMQGFAGYPHRHHAATRRKIVAQALPQ